MVPHMWVVGQYLPRMFALRVNSETSELSRKQLREYVGQGLAEERAL
jgi:hypothetical protein